MGGIRIGLWISPDAMKSRQKQRKDAEVARSSQTAPGPDMNGVYDLSFSP